MVCIINFFYTQLHFLEGAVQFIKRVLCNAPKPRPHFTNNEHQPSVRKIPIDLNYILSSWVSPRA